MCGAGTIAAMHEIELKFQVAPAALPALAHWLQARGAGCVAMRARYFDHPDRLLGRAGFALRLRREGGQWVQTLKGRGDGVMQRLEHNATVADPGGAQAPALDLARHADSPAGQALTALLAAAGCGVEALQLQYETDFERLVWTVRHDGAEIEVALDRGVIRADGRELPIAELEFELLSGTPAALLAFARGWVEPWALWLDVRSKAERGDRLARRGEVPVAALPAPGAAPQAWMEALLVSAAPLMAGEARREHLGGLCAALQGMAATEGPGRVGLAGLYEALQQLQGDSEAQAQALVAAGERLRAAAVQTRLLDLLAQTA